MKARLTDTRETNSMLSMSEAWLKRFNGPPGLRELVVEYETIGPKRAQLDAIVARNKKWKLRLQDGFHLSAENTPVQEWKWMGRSDVGGEHWDHHGENRMMEYVVLVDRWILVDEPMDDEAKEKSVTDWGISGEDAWSDSEFDDDSDEDADEDEDGTSDAGLNGDEEDDDDDNESTDSESDGDVMGELQEEDATGNEQEDPVAPVSQHESTASTIFGGS